MPVTIKIKAKNHKIFKYTFKLINHFSLFSFSLTSPQISKTLVFRKTSKRFLVAIRSAVAPGYFSVMSFLLAYCSVKFSISPRIFLYDLRRSSSSLSFLLSFSFKSACLLPSSFKADSWSIFRLSIVKAKVF